MLWTPPPEAWSATTAGRFATRQGFESYAEMHAWSVADLDEFWAAVTDELGVRWRTPPTNVLADRAMPGARWFPGSTLNYAEHSLAPAQDRPEDVAVVARSQTRGPVELTWSELSRQVARCAAGLRRLGVSAGDRVGAYAPNVPETLVAFMATASLGAVWSSCAPEFGTRSVIDRFGQIEPTVLFAVDGYRYGTRDIDRTGAVEAIVAALPTVQHTISLRYLGSGADGWSDLLAGDDPGPPAFEPVAFDHPLYVLFSSGTTGLPKAIVHGHGGITVEHLKVLALHQDLTPADRFCWFTTTGWMMWNYLVSGLLTGATVVLFDGDPAQPDLTTLWDLAAETETTVFGASAPFLMACRKDRLAPARGSLRWVGSTGAPLPADGFRWVHDALDVPVSSISGGTDVCTAFLGTSPLVPVRAGEISCPLLGCDVAAYRPDASPCPPGEVGELVIRSPMPSMPVAFWDDADGSRYRAAYFDTYPGVWRHGDWISFTDDGAATISGRSDATLNRGGVRLGTSDFYAVVEAMAEVADSLVVHLEDTEGGGGELLLFVVPTKGCEVDETVQTRIREALRTEVSPRHVPDRIEVVAAVPRTLSGKKLEVPVKQILTGTAVSRAVSADALADPASLEPFVAFAAERSSSGG